MISERSGVVNIGLEGIMLTAAFVAWITGVVGRRDPGPGDPTAIFGLTWPLLIALVAARSVGHDPRRATRLAVDINVRADQIISGVIINIAARRPDRLPEHAHLKQSPARRGRLQRARRARVPDDLPLSAG